MTDFRPALVALVLTLGMVSITFAEEHAPAAPHGAEPLTDHGIPTLETHAADTSHADASALVCTEQTLAEDAERRAANPIVAKLMLELPNCPQSAANIAHQATAEVGPGQKPAKAAH